MYSRSMETCMWALLVWTATYDLSHRFFPSSPHSLRYTVMRTSGLSGYKEIAAQYTNHKQVLSMYSTIRFTLIKERKKSSYASIDSATYLARRRSRPWGLGHRSADSKVIYCTTFSWIKKLLITNNAYCILHYVYFNVTAVPVSKRYDYTIQPHT